MNMWLARSISDTIQCDIVTNNASDIGLLVEGYYPRCWCAWKVACDRKVTGLRLFVLFKYSINYFAPKRQINVT